MNIKNIKIWKKLMLGFASLLLVAIIIGYIGYNGMKLIDIQHDEVSNNRLPSVRSLLIISQSQAKISAGENALLASNLTAEMEKSAFESMAQAKVRADEAWKTYEPLSQSAEEKELWKDFVMAWKDWWSHHEDFLQQERKCRIDRNESNLKALGNFALVHMAEPTLKSENLLKQLIAINGKIADESNRLADSQSSQAFSLLLLVIFLGVVLSVGLSIIISRAITLPLAKGVKLAEAVAMGDLTVVIDIQQKDEIGQLADALKNMVGRLKSLTSEIKSGVAVLSTSAAEILSTVTEISTGAAETATSVSETTTTVEEVRQTAMVSNQKAQSMLISSQKAADSVEKGRESIEEVISSMKKIESQMLVISETILKLADQNRTIGEITASVADIADQSNLLAVNAAIEAAKAGEHGRGFSVIAQEIRNLSDQSKKATIQVKEIINEINRSVNQAVGVTDLGSKTVEEGMKLVVLSGEVIELLSESVEETAQVSIQISSSSQQQMAGMEQIVPAMENIKLASEQNVTGIKQAQSAAHDLNSLGHNLREIIEKFKV